MMPVMATAAGTQDESAPEDHGDDENDASQGDDHGRKPKWPATSVPPVPPIWRFGGCNRLLSCSCRLSRMFTFSHRSQHALQSQDCAVRMRRRDIRSREPFAAIAYLDYHDVTKVNSDVSPAVTAGAGGRLQFDEIARNVPRARDIATGCATTSRSSEHRCWR